VSDGNAGAAPDSPRLKLASYNIHQCVGMDGRRDPERIAGVLREISADVIGLQEVSSRPGQRSDSQQMDYLAGALNLSALAGPTIIRHDGHYGNALLTRRRVLDVRQVDLTVYKREPRGALDVDLEVPGGTLRFIVTHLGLLPGERRTQVRRLLDILGAPSASAIVLCGDINEWFSVGRPLRWLHGRLGRPPTLPTFPAGFPLFALDRIWVRPRDAVVTWDVHRSPTARVASDHLPLVAEIELRR
jgi:endonuclease/exonuclease/phosphatase family metal-dependent hydrolase